MTDVSLTYAAQSGPGPNAEAEHPDLEEHPYMGKGSEHSGAAPLRRPKALAPHSL